MLPSKLLILPKRWQRYTVALGVTIVSLGLIGLLNSLTGLSFFQLSLFAVVVIALYGGFWPAVLSALMSAAAIDFLFMDPRIAFGLEQWTQGVQLLVFALLAVIIATLADSRERVMQALHRRTAELEAVNEELRTFSQLVSHDIRRPLRVIDGYAHILLRDHAGVLSEAPQRYLSAISNAGQQISLLVTQLLDLSRIGRQPLQIEEVDVAALAREAIENLKVEWEFRQVDFVVHPLPQCRADRQLLKQALLNLIDNALKFTRDRSPAHIVIGSTAKGPVTSYYVADNGIGFDMQQADKLFMPFQRLHPEYPGIGIGLAIVDRIVRRHGGRVWASSAMDKGTTMYLTIGNASYG